MVDAIAGGAKTCASHGAGGADEMHPLVLLAAYVVVALLPLALAAAQGAPPRFWTDELSSALALVAFSMLLVESVLSGRFRAVSGRIGIDLAMRFHQLMARVLTAFLLVHPFLYTTPINPRLPWDGTGRLSLGLDAASLASGLIAWLLLLALTLSAVFRDRLPYRYETWRLAHGLGAAMIAGLGVHHAIEAGRYSGHGDLAAFWLAALAVALLSLVYVYLLTPLRQLRHRYRIVSVRPLGLRAWELAIAPERGDALSFQAGQFVWLTVGRSPFSVTEHPFSISSSPAARPRIDFAIKETGDFTRTVGRLPVGAPAYVDGPHGNLTLAGRTAAGLALIAGGVGLAPLLSILRQLRVEGDRRPIVLVYGNRVAEQILYREELAALSTELDLEVHHVLSEPPPAWDGAVGRPDEPVLRRLLAPAERRDWLFLVCGPAPMIDAVEDSLGRLGVPAGQIASEKFSYD